MNLHSIHPILDLPAPPLISPKDGASLDLENENFELQLSYFSLEQDYHPQIFSFSPQNIQEKEGTDLLDEETQIQDLGKRGMRTYNVFTRTKGAIIQTLNNTNPKPRKRMH